ncbi:MAG TPA: hypothetical protein VF587_09080, partial [Solirubrobacteraceae bacterium]
DFLDLPADEGWVARCATLLYKSPNRTRATRAWSEADVRVVRAGMERFDHLSRYRSDELQAA